MDPPKRKLTSAVWEYFTPDETRSTAACNKCKKLYQTPKGCTTGLIRHLTFQHNIHIEGLAKRDAPCEKLGMSAIEFVSRLSAVDGIAFSTIARSQCIQLAFSMSSNTTLPSSPSSVREAIQKFYAKSKVEIKQQLAEYRSNGKKFTISLDEWTSGSRRRYMNVNLHLENQFWTLGLVRIKGSFTSEACLQMLEEKLLEYDVRLDDVFAFVTDGAAVMKRFGRISTKCHQLCYSHGIHLAIVDVIYKKVDLTIDSEIMAESENGSEEENDSSFVETEEEIQYEENLHSLIGKVRKVVKFFQNSPKRNEVLIQHDPGSHHLILDTKTRWNSLLAMLERFVLMKDSIRKAFIDLQEHLEISEDDFKQIEDLVHTLLPVKLAVDKICRRDATLYTADVSMKFMMDKLQLRDTSISKNLFDAVKLRIRERRTILSDVLAFLHFNWETLPGQAEGYFEKVSKQAITLKIKELYSQYSNTDLNCDEEQDDGETQESESLICEVSLESELNLAIKQAKNYKAVKDVALSSRNLSSAINKEMSTFQCTGDRGRILEFVYSLLSTIPPSSVEAERVFSGANSFCTRTRSRLGDSSLSELVFLKWFFKHNETK